MQGDLDSFLIEITGEILKHKDSADKSKHTVDLVLDAAGQKGTGKWTCQMALDLGQPLTLIAEAVRDAHTRARHVLTVHACA
jgi:6-phosphogluconate dehydrogenase